MKYAREVIDLLAAYPGREFRMIQIVRHVSAGKPADAKEWERIRKGVRRVLESLEESGQVDSNRQDAMNGGFALYMWKPGHHMLANRDGIRDNIGSRIAS